MKKLDERFLTRIQRACRDAIKKGQSPIAKRVTARLKRPNRIGED
jgi:hypothetical protein